MALASSRAETSWAEGDYSRLPALSADLVRRNVTVIAEISGTPAALAAKAATTNIPIVFAIGGDPITPGLVSSLGHPSGNVTGVSFYNTASNATIGIGSGVSRQRKHSRDAGEPGESTECR